MVAALIPACHKRNNHLEASEIRKTAVSVGEPSKYCIRQWTRWIIMLWTNHNQKDFREQWLYSSFSFILLNISCDILFSSYKSTSVINLLCKCEVLRIINILWFSFWKASSEMFLSFTPVGDAAVKSYILLITSPSEVIKRSYADVP